MCSWTERLDFYVHVFSARFLTFLRPPQSGILTYLARLFTHKPGLLVRCQQHKAKPFRLTALCVLRTVQAHVAIVQPGVAVIQACRCAPRALLDACR